MICRVCSFDNKEGARFCANCGKPLEAAVAQEPVNSDNDKNVSGESQAVERGQDTHAEQEQAGNVENISIKSGATESVQETPTESEDESDDKTTILTADMGSAGHTPVNGPAPIPENQGIPISGQAPIPGTPVNGQTPIPGTPINGQASKQANGKPAKQPKQPKPPKQPKQSGSAPVSTGIKAYIIASAVVIVALLGVGIYGYIHFNGKLDDADKKYEDYKTETDEEILDLNTQIAGYEADIEELNVSLSDYEEKVANFENQISGYDETNAENESKIAEYESTIEELKKQISDYEKQIDELSESTDEESGAEETEKEAEEE